MSADAYTAHTGLVVQSPATVTGDVVYEIVGTEAPYVIVGDDAVTTTVAGLMEKVSEPFEPVWFPSPANVYDAVAVPALVFAAYDGVRLVKSNPPTPVTAAEHNACAIPEYVVDFGEQVTVVVELARSMTNDDEALEPVWFASPTSAVSKVAVPAFVL